MRKILALGLSAGLLLFTGLAQAETSVCWTPPTENADGTPLDDLERYEVAMSPNADLSAPVLLDTQVEATANCYNIDETALTEGLWYFAVRACDEVDNCAEWSNVAGPKSVDTIAPAKILDLQLVEN